MLFYAWEFWHVAFERGWRSDTVWGVRLWIPYLSLVVGLALLLLQLVADVVAVAIGVDTPFGLED
jgi:TRAP-type C4-dicarboxylate transport system permease small subunit